MTMPNNQDRSEGPGTALPWAVETPMGEGSPWIVPAGQEAYEWSPIATLGDCLEDLPPRSAEQRRIIKDAAYIVLAFIIFPALVEALDALNRAADEAFVDGNSPCPDALIAAFKMADEALALAKASPLSPSNTNSEGNEHG